MAQIEIKTEKAQDMTRISFLGIVTSEDLLNALDRFYSSDATTKALWDFTGGDLSQLKTEKLFVVIDITKHYAHLRPGGKTALLVKGILAFGIARMHKTLAELERHPILMEIFTLENEALDWLNS